MSIAPSITIQETSGITFLNVDNTFAIAQISLYGGHVLSYIPKSDNIERLWLSPHAHMSGEKPIRGGIPICWPWFSDDHGREKGELPAHGFLRSQVWQLKSSEDTDKGTVVLLTPTFSRADGFEYDCEVILEIIVGESLTVNLSTRNTGIVPFTFNTAFHSYFEVPDINHIELRGLQGSYRDKTDSFSIKDTPEPYRFNQETDRIHDHAAKEISLFNKDKKLTQIHSSGHDSVVVWNPWQSAASISDMDAFGFKQMICVETAITSGKEVLPDECHILTQVIS
ncbi:D-hexose-6-phosphate mutarotase [Alteromonas sp. ASW11-130]|uniref:D-hexose-6-phosphate mutarotase n=1 Tax=Alteromonas sp. ASW11-130 TaxID=3015775 RepID=UPI0022424EC4|nr:D-hexose-6-phosphate mutarotase [Alteromonas sp. ASW11-130]MCW8092072.1 D-hexose-6-phosphate mutarotase [Alteromonas sp. ASW11-130]